MFCETFPQWASPLSISYITENIEKPSEIKVILTYTRNCNKYVRFNLSTRDGLSQSERRIDPTVPNVLLETGSPPLCRVQYVLPRKIYHRRHVLGQSAFCYVKLRFRRKSRDSLADKKMTIVSFLLFLKLAGVGLKSDCLHK